MHLNQVSCGVKTLPLSRCQCVALFCETQFIKQIWILTPDRVFFALRKAKC